MNEKNNFEILTSSKTWSATPWDYSSSRLLRFSDGENSVCVYGYGQTLYAVINFSFELFEENKLKITYLDSPAVGFFKGFIPNKNTEIKEIKYELTKKAFEGKKNITGRPFKYHWFLQLDNSPFPNELKFPYEIPLEFYGHFDCSIF